MVLCNNCGKVIPNESSLKKSKSETLEFFTPGESHVEKKNVEYLKCPSCNFKIVLSIK